MFRTESARMSMVVDDAPDGQVTVGGVTVGGATVDGVALGGATVDGATVDGATLVDGTMLRDLRRAAGVGLRRVASSSRVPVSDGHLSRVERGIRSVTPAIVTAYERALRVRVSDALARRGRGGGPFDGAQRQAFTSAVATVAVGGPSGEPPERLLAAGVSTTPAPARVGAPEVAHVEQAAAMVRDLDRQYGGGSAWQVAGGPLRWAVRLRAATMSDQVRERLETAVGSLAATAGWAAVDAGRQEAARALFTLALDGAVRARDADLRARVLAEVGAQFNHLGYPDDCLTIVRLADGDERVGPAVRHLLHGVKARAYAGKMDAHGSQRHLERAEEIAATVTPSTVPEWWGEFLPAQATAVTGQAAAEVAHLSGTDGDQADAHKCLLQAVDGLHAAGRSRTAALCLISLARLFLRNGDREQAACWARQAADAVDGLRSERVERALEQLWAPEPARHLE